MSGIGPFAWGNVERPERFEKLKGKRFFAVGGNWWGVMFVWGRVRKPRPLRTELVDPEVCLHPLRDTHSDTLRRYNLLKERLAEPSWEDVPHPPCAGEPNE